jgi:hypothetical protein
VSPGRGVVVLYGALRIVVDGAERLVRRGMLIEFRDTQALQESVNSGFGEFDAPEGDDTVATVLDGKAPARP